MTKEARNVPDPEFKRLDFSTIEFPSDDLTIGMLRKAHRNLFDIGFGAGNELQPKYFLQTDEESHAAEGIGNLLLYERVIASKAYADVRRIAGLLIGDYDALKDELAEYYAHYGLAAGKRHAKELIRDIERQGRELGQSKSR